MEMDSTDTLALEIQEYLENDAQYKLANGSPEPLESDWETFEQRFLISRTDVEKVNDLLKSGHSYVRKNELHLWDENKLSNDATKLNVYQFSRGHIRSYWYDTLYTHGSSSPPSPCPLNNIYCMNNN
jgi:hypothetical protein